MKLSRSRHPWKSSLKGFRTGFKVMNAQYRILIPALILPLVTLGVTVTTATLLHRGALRQEGLRLMEVAQSRARLFEAMGEHDSVTHLGSEGSSTVFEHTIEQLRRARTEFAGFGQTGEFTLARRDGDKIAFLLSHRHFDLDDPQCAPFRSELAELMHRALTEEKAGTVVALNYGDHRVPAAYEPARVFGLGIVGKTDLSGVGRPFIRAGHLAGAAAVLLVVLAAIAFLWIGRSVARRLDSAHAELKREISIRKRSEALVKKNEARLQSLIKLGLMKRTTERELIEYALEEIVCLTDSEIGYLHFVNPDQERIELYAWSKSALTHCAASKDLHYPLSRAGVWADCVRQRRPVIHNDYPNAVGKRGLPEGHVPVERHMSVPIFDEDNIVAIAGVGNKEMPYDDSDMQQLSLFVGSMWEILQRNRAEGALRESEERLDLALKGSQIGTFDWNIAEDHVICDETTWRIFGEEPESLDVNFGEFRRRVHSEDVEHVESQVRAALAGEADYDAEFRAVGSDGTIRHLRAAGRVHHDKDGNPVRMIGTHSDISERKQAEEALRESEREHRIIFENSPLGMVYFNHEGVIVNVNRRLVEILGSTREEMVGKNLLELPVLNKVHRALEKALAGETAVYEGEYVPEVAPRTRFIRAILTPIRPRSASTEVIASVEDITERKLIEGKLLEHEKLKVFSSGLVNGQEDERGRIARELHDGLNQRLAVLAIELGILAQKTESSIREEIQNLQQQTFRLSDQVRRLSHQLHPAALEHVGLTAALKSHCEEIGRQQKISIHFSVENRPEYVPAPVALCLYRVAQECLRNIGKHSGASDVQVFLTGSGDSINLFIGDDGKGFDPDAAAGKGLGLVSMEERVRLLNGLFSLESGPNKGTRVSVRVPLTGGAT